MRLCLSKLQQVVQGRRGGNGGGGGGISKDMEVETQREKKKVRRGGRGGEGVRHIKTQTIDVMKKMPP